ncbi:hypothetical protein [Aminobacter sp. J44]|uniref:hypothetical protein n=1 Tax=Aminobacter sp. J44 TaxID=935262 RepID=UPI0011A00847|nr:hypothetical protein [Aminobacter sp. J44]
MDDSPKEKIVKVAEVLNAFEVILNVGSLDGERIGNEYVIYRFADEIFDPDTNESLGYLEQVVGRGEIIHVQERISTLRSIDYESGNKKVIRRSSAFGVAMGRFSPEIEEIVESPDKPKPFNKPTVGDLAKRI